MPDFSTPSGSNQPYIPLLKREQSARVPGTTKVFESLVALQAAVDRERQNIGLGLPVWNQAERLILLTEPAGVSRRWVYSTGNGGNDSHARTVEIGVKTFLLGSDSSQVFLTSDSPPATTGLNGDLALDPERGSVFQKDAAQWGLSGYLWGTTPPVVTPVAPGQPRNFAAGTATTTTQPLSWEAPLTGTSPITYQVAYRLGSSTGAYTNFGQATSNLSITVTGLTPGTAYDYRLTPINDVGAGSNPALINDAATPSAGAVAPGAPTAVGAVAGDAKATVSGTAPASNGGAAINQYRATASPGGATGFGTSPSNIEVAGLANGTAYSFTMAARNSAGLWSAESTASSPVTPVAAAVTLRASEPFDAVFSGAQNNSSNTGRISLGNITLNPEGDWSLFVQTERRTTGLNMGGGILSIGSPSDSIYAARSSLVIGVFGSTTSNPWTNDNAYANALFCTAQDDDNTTATSRSPISTMQPGGIRPNPLLGRAGAFAAPGYASYGILVRCVDGNIELYDVDPAHDPILQDAGPGIGATRNDDVGVRFKGITDKPMYIGFVNQLTQNTQATRTYWGGPIGQVVVYNGGAMTMAQARMLAQGVDARDVLSLDGSRGDRYWPGSAQGAQLKELVAGQHGTVEGVGVTLGVATTRPQRVEEYVTVGWRPGTIFPAAPSPATTTTFRIWGNRVGPGTTTIQVRVVALAAAYPAAAGDVVVDWVDVATNVAAGPWAGNVPNIPHAAAVWFRFETRFRKADTSWSTPVRLQSAYGAGDGLMIVGQSIAQGWADTNGSHTIATGSIGKIWTYDKFFPVYSKGRVDSSNYNGWLPRGGVAASTTKYGQTVFCDLLTRITGRRSYVINQAIAGTSILRFAVGTTAWLRLKEVIQQARPLNMVFNNGQGDMTMTRAQRWAALDAMYDAYVDAINTAPGGGWTGWTFWVIPVGSDFSTPGGTNSVRAHDIAWIKQRLLDGKNVGLATSITDQPNDLDGTHPRAVPYGMGCMSERLAQMVAYKSNFITHDGNGGYLESGTWSWSAGTLSITLPITGGNGTYATRGGGAPSGFTIIVNGSTYTAPSVSALTGSTVTLEASVAVEPTSVAVTYLQGAPGPAGGGPTTPSTTSGINNALFDVRSGMISGSPGMPVLTLPEPLTLTKV